MCPIIDPKHFAFDMSTWHWKLQLIRSTSEVEHELTLPDFTRSAEPTRDLANFVTSLAVVKFPAWHRGMTIAVSTILMAYLIVGWGIFFWRIYKKSFWLFRWQEGRIVPNGLNVLGAFGGLYLLQWIVLSRTMIDGGYIPSVFSLLVASIWLGAWSIGWGSVYCIPSATPFTKRSFSARQMNTFFIGVPVAFCTQVFCLGIPLQLRYDEALASASALRRVLEPQLSSAPVTDVQLQGALDVWSKFVIAWSYASLQYFLAGLWSLAAGLFYGLIFVRLFRELRRQKREHVFGVSAAGAQVDPIWSIEATAPEGTIMESLLISSRATPYSVRIEIDSPHFFPPFKPPPSVFTDKASVMFRKCMHNLCASGLLSLSIFMLIAVIAWYVAIAGPQTVRTSDRQFFVMASLVNQLYISFALVLIGALVVAEILAQSLQPVLGSWVYAPKIVQAPREKPFAPSHSRSRSRGPSRLQALRYSFGNLVSRLPKATTIQVERVSVSFLEARSVPQRQRLNSAPDGPEPPASLVSLGLPEEVEMCHEDSHDHTIQAGFRRARSVPSNLRAIYGLDPRQQCSQRHSTSLEQDAVLADYAHPGRDSPLPYDVQVRKASYDEIRAPRIFPLPATPARVHFTRQTQVTYENIPTSSPEPFRRPEQPFRPSWRSPASELVLPYS